MGVECVAAVPKPRKRREGEFITTPGSAPPPPFSEDDTPTRDARALPSPAAKPPVTSTALTSVPVDSLLSRGDLHHTGSKSFTALLAQGLGLETVQAVSAERAGWLRGWGSLIWHVRRRPIC